MNCFAIVTLAASLVAVPALAGLKQGEAAPNFSAKASLAGKEFDFSLKNALKKGPVVVYFYPSAFTGGCNAEAHAFAEDRDKFDAAHVTIIGVSQDSIARLDDFSSDPQYCASKFPVASDPDGAIAKSFDLRVMQGRPGMNDSRGQPIDHAFTERTTFVIAKDGKVAAVLSSSDDHIAPADHAEKSLAIAQELTAGK